MPSNKPLKTHKIFDQYIFKRLLTCKIKRWHQTFSLIQQEIKSKNLQCEPKGKDCTLCGALEFGDLDSSPEINLLQILVPMGK